MGDNLDFLNNQNFNLNHPKIRQLLDKLGANGEKGKELTDRLIEQLREYTNTVTGFSEDDKQTFSNELKKLLNKGLKDKLRDKQISQPSIGIYFIVFVAFIVLAFFGYKLYKNLMDKERRREEKAKAKQGKKKK